MVRNSFTAALVIGVVVVALAVAGIFYMERGSHMDLPGRMLRAYTLSTGPDTSVALVDLHLTNTSDYPVQVHNIDVILEKTTGEQFPRGVVARVDAERLFAAMPESGPYHAPLYTTATVAAHATADYTVAAPFEAPEQMLRARKRFLVQVQVSGGKMYEFSEK